ncbi:uncharacterized protein [Pocillopora verrucosa]|uniref:uncharacterized protein isoform X1 n=1 Tax=Pocillopora verrucosa TaxID=203993 RepID=UPI00333E9BFB
MYKSVFNGVIAIVFIWSNVAILCVLCPSPSGIHNESKLAGQMKLCRRRCGLRFQADDAESTSNEGLRERHQSSYEECLSFVRKRCLRSRPKKQKQYLDQRTKREIRGADNCFIEPTGKNDTVYSPESISLTLKNWKSSGGYEGEVSWKPFKDDALNWTGYRVIYVINDTVIKCRDFGKNFTSYKIPLKLQSGWDVTALVTLLPFPTGYKFSIPYCFVSDEKNCKKGSTIEITTTKASATTTISTPDAPKCFKPKGKNDTIYSPESISLTLKNWKSSGGYEGEVSWKPFKDDALNWTGYRVIYVINDTVIKCRDFGKNFTSYKIPLKLQSGWDVTALVTLLPFPTGYKFSIPYCFVSDEKNCKKGSTISITTTKAPATTTILTPGNKNTIIIIIGVVLAIAFLAGVIATLRYCRRSKTDLTPSMPDLKFEYDAFVIFSSQDSDWVVNTLIPTLEKKHGLKCCIHYRNFTPGVLFRDNVVDSVYKCRKTLAIVSTHFFDSNYCGSELDFALHRLMEKRDDSLVVIKLDEVDKRKLPMELQERSYIDYSKSVEKEAWEKKLVDCLKNKAKK